MARIVVISFNMQGVSGAVIAQGMLAINPDIVALQEAPTGSAQFYQDLQTALGTKASDYCVLGPIREYPVLPPMLKGGSLDAQGSMKQICVIYNTKTMKHVGNFELVDLLNDKYTPMAKDVHHARDLGFASRTPGYCQFDHIGLGIQPPPRIGLYVWHAPTKVDPAHKQALQYFGQSWALKNARTNNKLTILAGDFNDDMLPSAYKFFDEGIQHKFDWVLADKATGYKDLLAQYRSTLDQMHTTSQDHFAMAAEFTY